jgi:hypothetical protein
MWSSSFAGSMRSRTALIGRGLGEGEGVGATVAVGVALAATADVDGLGAADGALEHAESTIVSATARRRIRPV